MKFPTIEEIMEVQTVGFPVKAQGKYPTTLEPVWLFTQSYGDNKNKGLYGPDGHSGQDVKADIGDDLLAIGDGEVVEVGEYKCGKYIRYNLDSKITKGGVHFYLEVFDLHLDAQGVEIGEKVSKGQIIGSTGNTGYPACSTGPHLHHAVRLYASDGVNWLRQDKSRGYIDPAQLYDKPNLTRYRFNGFYRLYTNGLPIMDAIKQYDGQNIKSETSPDVYHVKFGQRHKFPDEVTMWAHGFATTNCITVEQAVMNEIPIGEDMNYFEGQNVDAVFQLLRETSAGNADKFLEKYH
tara:strand:- start:2009 stop:2887 length:879 start_codon:yes stop_codon:yes gene_type:complete